MCHNVTSLTEARGADLPKINKVRNSSRRRPCEVRAPDGFSYFGIFGLYHTILCGDFLRWATSWLSLISLFNTLNLTSDIFPSSCPFLPLSSPFLPLTNPSYLFNTSLLPLPLSFSPSLGPADCHSYLPNIDWQRRSGIFLLIEDQSSKVSSSKPAPSISRPQEQRKTSISRTSMAAS